MSDERTFRVSEIARLVGVSASTLRLWEKQGLLQPTRTASGQRRYGADDLDLARRVAWMRNDGDLGAKAIRAVLDTQPASEALPRQSGQIGQRLRVLRHAAGLTLDQVAAEVGIAPSALSTLERTSQGASLGALQKLAQFHGTTVSELNDMPGTASTMVRAGSWRSWPATIPGVTVQLLAEGKRQMDCHRFVLAPGAGSEDSYAHEGEEFMHVLSGHLQVVLDSSERYELRPGDSLYFQSFRHHAWQNISDGETVIIWINTPPTF